jgi:hypothetical protein
LRLLALRAGALGGEVDQTADVVGIGGPIAQQDMQIEGPAKSFEDQFRVDIGANLVTVDPAPDQDAGAGEANGPELISGGFEDGFLVRSGEARPMMERPIGAARNCASAVKKTMRSLRVEPVSGSGRSASIWLESASAIRFAPLPHRR